MPHSSHSRVLCTAVTLVLATAPGLGCAVLGQIFGIKKEEDKPKPTAQTAPEPKKPDPLPQPEYTEAQWAEYTAAAEAKVKEAGAPKLLPPMRLVGTYPSAEQTVDVKGGHCYDLGVAWYNPENATSVYVHYLKDAKGQRSSDSRPSAKGRIAPPAGAMQFCVDHDGQVKLELIILTRSNSMLITSSRKEPVQWAVALGERKEDKQAAEARRKDETAEEKAKKLQARRNQYRYNLEHHGRAVADSCERCRRMAEMCLEERKDQGEQKAFQYCGMSWENCADQVGRRHGSRMCTPP